MGGSVFQLHAHSGAGIPRACGQIPPVQQAIYLKKLWSRFEAGGVSLPLRHKTFSIRMATTKIAIFCSKNLKKHII